MEIRILGSVEVAQDGEALPVGGPRERALLVLLALSPGRVVGTDHLIEALWGEDPPGNPLNALQALVSRLRRAIGAQKVVTRPPGYLLDVPAATVDAVRFRELVDAATAATDPAARSGRFAEALELWRGAALADFPFDDFAQREAAALEELRLTALEARIAADLQLGAGPELVPELEELVAAHPVRESLRASQMLALYRAGRQADALRAYQAAREVLGEELGIEPGPELRDLEEAILLQAPSLLDLAQPGARARRALPLRLDSFVGRAAEMDQVVAAFASSRLVTLTGSGGAGKTSLAVEVGRARETHHRDGVWLIELAPVTDPSMVPDTLVMALDLHHVGDLGSGHAAADPMAIAVEFLRERDALLIVDNCEHVVAAASAAIEAVLLACPEVEVLATSRDRLGVPGELLWRVPPLGLPDGDAPSEAVTLFVDRARAVNPSFGASNHELVAAAEICRKVDGMPLAIELAAARTRSLSVADIATRLASGIGVLAGGPRSAAGRQQTLRATIDWSYQLLGGPERELFAALSVFHGSFGFDGVVAAAPPEPAGHPLLERLERLIDSSVVTPAPSGTTVRYRLLEPVRIYAAEKLAAGGDTDAVMERLIGHFLAKLANLEDRLRGSDQLEWLDRVEADHGTIRAVLEWGATHAPDRALRLAGRLGWFWYLRGSGSEARERLGTLLEAAGGQVDARARGDGWFFKSLHDPQPDQSQAGFGEALTAYEAAGHQRGVGNAIAMMAAWGREWDETITRLDTAAAVYSDAGDEWGIALVRFLQAGARMTGNQVARALRLAEEATARFAALGDRWGQGYSLYTVGIALRAGGDYDAAERAFRQALDHARPMRLRREMAPVIAELAGIATMRGDFDTAERLLVEARDYADAIPFAGSQGMVRNAQGRLARLRGDLESAHRLHRSSIELYAAAGNAAGLAYSHSCLGFTLEMHGDLAGSLAQHRLALDNAMETSDHFAIALALEGVGATAIAAGDTVRGLELIGGGLGIREEAGTPLPAGERFDVDRSTAAAAERIDPATVEQTLARGRALEPGAAIKLAST